MSTNSKLCAFCNENLESSHGNQRYHEDCVYLAKMKRSIDRYAYKNLQLDPYWRNEKILRELYSVYGERKEIDPALLESKGFDIKLCKSQRQANGYSQFFMHQFGFSIQQNKKIILWKI